MATAVLHRIASPAPLPWLLLIAGWAIAYGPTYWDLAQGIWRSEEQFHGAIVLLVSAWLLLMRPQPVAGTADAAGSPASATPRPVAGAGLFGLGLALYVLGRSQDILLLEVGSQMPVLAGALLALGGRAVLRAHWFPLVFLVFMVPLPGALVDALTGQLKQWVSVVAENLLYLLGYPVARQGVMLVIGPYQLLVADACSGLYSMFSLSALGVLYMHLSGRRSALHNGLMLASILPIAFCTNVVRVVALVLVTYHLGDEAGQGFLHGMAGIVLILVALGLLFVLDGLLSRLFPVAVAPRPAVVAAPAPRYRLLPVAMLVLALAAALAAAEALRPRVAATPGIELERAIPGSFGEWRQVPGALSLVASPTAQASLDRLYSQTLARLYVDASGERVMLALAYGGRQTDELKAHRPEVCYPAQGFQLLRKSGGVLALAGTNVPVTRLVAAAGARVEPVTYWLAVGGRAAATDFQRKLVQLRFGLTGTIPDGMLVRISSIEADADHAYQVHERFARDLVAALPAATRSRIGVAG